MAKIVLYKPSYFFSFTIPFFSFLSFFSFFFFLPIQVSKPFLAWLLDLSIYPTPSEGSLTFLDLGQLVGSGGLGRGGGNYMSFHSILPLLRL